MGTETIQPPTTEPDPLQELADGLQAFGHPVRIRVLVMLEHEHSPNGLTQALGGRRPGRLGTEKRLAELRDWAYRAPAEPAE
jgi:hypothetical protein